MEASVIWRVISGPDACSHCPRFLLLNSLPVMSPFSNKYQSNCVRQQNSVRANKHTSCKHISSM